MITGARQVGKSTFIKEFIDEERQYVTLDDMNLRTLAKEDPQMFLMNYKGSLIIDEVQYAPELFPYIKMNVDNSEKKGQYFFTGSQKFELMKMLQNL